MYEFVSIQLRKLHILIVVEISETPSRFQKSFIFSLTSKAG